MLLYSFCALLGVHYNCKVVNLKFSLYVKIFEISIMLSSYKLNAPKPFPSEQRPYKGYANMRYWFLVSHKIFWKLWIWHFCSCRSKVLIFLSSKTLTFRSTTLQRLCQYEIFVLENIFWKLWIKVVIIILIKSFYKFNLQKPFPF